MPSSLAPPSADVTGKIVISVEPSLEAVGAGSWNALWARAEAPSVFARYEWMAAWWRSFGVNRELRLYVARTNGVLTGLLPTSWPGRFRYRSDPVVLLGDEHADYAGILTAANADDVLAALLAAAWRDLPARGRLLLRNVRSDTTHAQHLDRKSHNPLGHWQRVANVPCPRATLNPERIQVLANKDSLKRHSKKLAKLGRVEFRHYSDAADILPRMNAFFEQHIARWSATEWPSLFLKDENRAFYLHLVEEFSGTGPLVFTELSLAGMPAAFHVGFVSEGDFIWYKPSFDPALARHSPGEVLLRELLRFAGAQGLTGFDFTRGDEAFKKRFSDDERFAMSFLYCSERATAVSLRGREFLRRRLQGLARTSCGSTLRRWAQAMRR